jgi:mannose-6-phosphate isomerase
MQHRWIKIKPYNKSEAWIMEKKNSKIDRRPWGHFEILSDGKDHKVKRITIYPEKRLSLQSHKLRSEHWFIVQGQGVVSIDGKITKIITGQSVDINKEILHRMENTGKNDLVFIEVQTGDYFGEDDIVRFEDDYDRIAPAS